MDIRLFQLVGLEGIIDPLPVENLAPPPKKLHIPRDIAEKIVRIGERLADYVHKERIPNVMFVDRVARPGYVALKGAWKKKFGNEKSPQVYFTNPRGYEERG